MLSAVNLDCEGHVSHCWLSSGHEYYSKSRFVAHHSPVGILPTILTSGELREVIDATLPAIAIAPHQRFTQLGPPMFNLPLQTQNVPPFRPMEELCVRLDCSCFPAFRSCPSRLSRHSKSQTRGRARL